MRWRTAISQSKPEGSTLRGYKLDELTGKLTFTETVWLALKGELPNEKQAKMLDAIFVSSIDHGIAVPSVTSARIVASGGNSFNTAVAAGVLAMGDHHGGAVEGCARVLQENVKGKAAELVKEYREDKKRMPGYGHKIYTTDPRAQKLLEIARELKLAGAHVKLALEVEKELEKQSCKKLPLNVDGAIAAIISDLGFDWRSGKAFFIIPRTAGVCAHVHEELTREEPFRRLEEKETEYDGPIERPLKR